MNRINSTVNRLFLDYKDWINKNPQLISDIEGTMRFLSYLSAGRFNNSTLASEFIYSMPNLLVLLNDLILYSSKYVHVKLTQFDSKIKIWLTVLEYTETLLEISAQKLWGATGRWMMITFVQILKTVMRLVLVHVNKERITKTPPIPPLNREKLNAQKSTGEQIKEGFTLKRCGVVVRSVKTSELPNLRTWSSLLPKENECEMFNGERPNQRSLLLAEFLYILKPLVHLGSLSFTGKQRWEPWCLSLVFDLASLKLIRNSIESTRLTHDEKEEIRRRQFALLLYILRSPFYENCSRVRIYSFLDKISATVPFSKLITDPIRKYLPHWQNTYFYMWSS